MNSMTEMVFITAVIMTLLIVSMSVQIFNKNNGFLSGTGFVLVKKNLFYCPCCSLSNQLLLFIPQPSRLTLEK